MSAKGDIIKEGQQPNINGNAEASSQMSVRAKMDFSMGTGSGSRALFRLLEGRSRKKLLEEAEHAFLFFRLADRLGRVGGGLLRRAILLRLAGI